MSFADLRAAIEAKTAEMEGQAPAEQQRARERLLGPVDERPGVATLDKALVLRDADPQAFATLPAEMQRQANSQAIWRANRARTTGDAA